MTVRLPFTLTPHEGQDFAAWLDAYAVRLDVTRTELTDALGLPDHLHQRRTTQRRSLLDTSHVQSVTAATGLSAAAIDAMCSAVPSDARAATAGELSVVERLRRATTVSPRARF